MELRSNLPRKLVFLHIFRSAVPAGSLAVTFCLPGPTSVAASTESNGNLFLGRIILLFGFLLIVVRRAVASRVVPTILVVLLGIRSCAIGNRSTFFLYISDAHPRILLKHTVFLE